MCQIYQAKVEKKTHPCFNADDFCIITTNKARHQKLINEIQENTESMGLKLKPSKCRSFSIQKGKPTVTYYKIGENVVPSVQEEEQKFLGKLVFFKGKPSETYEHIKNEIETKIDYVTKTKGSYNREKVNLIPCKT